MKLRLLAMSGRIPRRLLKVRVPKCAGCLYGAMTRVPWWTKTKQGINHKIFAATRTGQCISVDQMQGWTPGFIAQLKGRLTKDGYTAAT
eukprot:9272456-Ditylum_brightwellii.AAC.1